MTDEIFPWNEEQIMSSSSQMPAVMAYWYWPVIGSIVLSDWLYFTLFYSWIFIVNRLWNKGSSLLKFSSENICFHLFVFLLQEEKQAIMCLVYQFNLKTQTQKLHDTFTRVANADNLILDSVIDNNESL